MKHMIVISFPKITDNYKLTSVSNFKNDNTTYYRTLCICKFK